jgi:hypothetical protein
VKRLRDQRGSSDPLLSEAARLVSARAPLADDTARRQRVRAKLRRRRKTPLGAAWVRAAAMLLLVCSVAAASAMVGRVVQTIRAHIEEARAAKRQEQAAATHRRPRPIAPTAPIAPTSPIAPTAPIAPLAPIAPAVPIAPTAPIAPAPPARIVAPLDRESDEQRLVVDAVRALRHEHAPARAAQLLTRYLDRYPDGAAAEDALALALEATIDRDPSRASAFARSYLARYPSGRWSSLAHRALAP